MARAKNEVATKLAKLKEFLRNNGRRRVPHGATTEIIAETKKYGFDAKDIIPIGTIQSHQKEDHQLFCASKGTKPMLAHLEAYFVDTLLQLTVMHQPVNKSTALNLINSLAETAQLHDYIVEWKEKHLPQNKLVSSNSILACEEHGAYLGDTYW